MADLRRMVSAALVAGLLAGLWLSAARQWWVVPLILQAETFEQSPAEHVHADGHGAPDATSEWKPAEGFQRNAWTWTANLLTTFGFALLLVAGYALRGRAVTLLQGLLWGAAGFTVFSLAPALGLPPELPGAPESPLMARQVWWLATVLATAGGLGLLAFGPGRWRWLGLPLLALPHAVGAPHASEAVAAPLAALLRQFIAATLLVNLSCWLMLGTVSAWVWSRKPWHIAA